MNLPDKAHEHYKKMLAMPGKFTIEFHNLSVYKGLTLSGGNHK